MATSNLNMQKASGGILNIQPVDGVTNTSVTIPESGNLVSVDTPVTDNAIARYDGTTGKLQGSGVIIDDNGNVGIGTRTTYPQHKLSIGYPTILPSTAGSKITAFSKEISVGGGNTSYLRFDTVRTSAGSTNHYSAEERIQKVVDAIEMGYIGFGYDTVKLGTNSGDKVLIDASGNLLLTSGTGALGYGAGAGGTVTQLTSKSTAVTLNKPCGHIITHNESMVAGSSVQFQLINSLANANINGVVLTIAGGGAALSYNVWGWVGIAGSIYIVIKNVGVATVADSVVISFQLIKGATA